MSEYVNELIEEARTIAKEISTYKRAFFSQLDD